MRYTNIIATVAVLALGTQSALAAASKEENIGVGTGAIVGALAGGPVGLVIGAAFGAKLGDSLNKKSERIDTLQGSLQRSEQSVSMLERDIDELNGEVQHLQSIARPELVSLMQAGIDMDLLFRTDEFALTDTTGDRLAQLAASIAKMPGVQIQLDGFADERGDTVYNHALSEKRVEFVRDLFIAAGVHPTRINSSAHGESVAQSQNLDSYALERRVSVKLFIDNTQSLASNPR
ncbi:MAG: OmpA family protein [Woeseiaceae bacterium]|nr:OmpA family protein [Woeseiaceae bacterium]